MTKHPHPEECRVFTFPKGEWLSLSEFQESVVPWSDQAVAEGSSEFQQNHDDQLDTCGMASSQVRHDVGTCEPKIEKQLKACYQLRTPESVSIEEENRALLVLRERTETWIRENADLL